MCIQHQTIANPHSLRLIQHQVELIEITMNNAGTKQPGYPSFCTTFKFMDHVDAYKLLGLLVDRE